ncbi:MAG: FlgD immunoglobulin-like domain containing protein [Candidatus Kapaibacterium sp.]
MKRLLSTLFFLLAVSFPLRAQVGESVTNHDPSRNREDEEGFKEERNRWMSQMHRAEPGVNVEVLNGEIRRAKRKSWEEKGASLLRAEEGIPILPGLFGYWSERGSNNQAGRTLSADIDYATGTIYTAADGGQIWRGTIEGKDWKPLNDPERFPGVQMLRIYRSDNLFRLIVLYGPYLKYSDDGGTTWQTADSLENIQRWGGFSRGVLTDGPAHILYLLGNEWNYGTPWGAYRTLYRSDDLGETFREVRRFDQPVELIDISAVYGEDDLWLLHGDTLSRILSDGSMEIVEPSLQLEGGMEGVSNVNLRVGSGEIFYLHVRRRGQNEIYGSNDTGKSWTMTGTTTGLFSRNSFAASPSNPYFIVAGGVEVLYSTDAGWQWDTVNQWGAYYGDPENLLHADIPFIGFFHSPNGNEEMLISTDGGLYRSVNQLESVKNLALKGLGISQYYSVYTSRADSNYVFAGAQDQGFQRTRRDEGGIMDFEQGISGDYGHITSGDGGRSVWTNYPGFSMYYPEALRSNLGWGLTHDFPTKRHLWLPPIVADPDTPYVAWVAGGGIDSGAHLIRMEYQQGADITSTEHPFDFSGGSSQVNLTAIGISPVDTKRWYTITSDGRFWGSKDRGETWQEEVFTPPGGHYFYGAAITPSKSNPEIIYVAGSGYSNPGVWVSRDGGETFDSLNVGLPPTLVYGLSASNDDRYLFAATAVGPYMYTADSGRWFDISGGVAPDQTWWSVDYIDENRIARFGTYGRGIWDFRLVTDTTNSVGEEVLTGLSGLELSARTLSASGEYEFQLQMPRSGFALLNIFDLTGRRVATLHDGSVEAGLHYIYWNGKADDGTSLPPGEYFCVASAFGTVAYVKSPLFR